MKRILSYYATKAFSSIIDHLWIGIWTAIGFILVMKATNVFIVLTG